MKCLQRCLSVLLCCVLLSVAFSVTANAEAVTLSPYHIYATSAICSATTCNTHIAMTFYPNNGEEETKSQIAPNTTAIGYAGAVIHTQNLAHEMTYTIALDNGNAIIKAGNKTTVDLSKFYNSIKIKNLSTNVVTTTANVSTFSVHVTYTDNTTQQISTNNIKPNIDYEYTTLDFTFTPQRDVKSIYVMLKTPLKNYCDNSTSIKYSIEHFIGEYVGDNSHVVSISQQSEEAGLLSGLLSKVQNIFDSVKDGFSNLGQGITNVFNELKNGFANMVSSITELPSKIWDFISEGLKNLFIPDEEYLAQMSDNWNSLLSNRFGAIYQSSQVIYNFWEGLDEYENKSYISIPEVSLEKVGIPFKFGGYDVQIIPSMKFMPIITAIQIITTFLATAAFINGLRKRYDKVMGE